MAGKSYRRRVNLDDVIDLILSSVDKKTKANEHAVRLCNYMDVYDLPPKNWSKYNVSIGP